MNISNTLNNISKVFLQEGDPEVVYTCAQEIKSHKKNVDIQTVKTITRETIKNGFLITTNNPGLFEKLGITNNSNKADPWIYFSLDDFGNGSLISSHTYLIYSFLTFLIENKSTNKQINESTKNKFYSLSFKQQRISYDYFLTQEGRIQKGLNRGSYIKDIARLGFTHIEVNGLAFPMGLETGPEGEAYPMFYTYCPALDQFVNSELNKGLYPDDYLAANLNYLKENAQQARKYGLIPGLLCFEPRSVPDKFFEKYPMLRGARVDHPFRSFKPRYNMTITHPLVRDHYREMLHKIMKTVPELGYICIWTNDSGAGFEHTKSLYVGRNGGAYLIREWKDDEEIAKLAGNNAIRYFKTLRDAGREINPEFRVITRMESFYGEHDTVWKGLEDGLEIETTSLIGKGWEMPYSHPLYPEVKDISGGSIWQQQFDDRENTLLEELQVKGSAAHFYFTAGPHIIFEPLLGLPYPELTYKRLKMLQRNGVEILAHTGGSVPKELVPFNINHEISRRFQFDSDMNINDEISGLAMKWAGKKFAPELVKAWEKTEKAIIAFPNVTSLYTTFGFTWYRLWARPLVPNIEALPQEKRDYYENFMCTTPHNPNNVDLSRDVLFQLTDPEKCEMVIYRIDHYIWEPLEDAIAILRDIQDEAMVQLGDKNIIFDQYIRLKALKCWIMTQRNVAAWIVGVYGYMKAKSQEPRAKNQDGSKIGNRQLAVGNSLEILDEMIGFEIENSREIKRLLESGVEFMAMTDKGETPLVYGDNLKVLLDIRIELMEKHRYDEPYIDFDYIEKKAAWAASTK